MNLIIIIILIMILVTYNLLKCEKIEKRLNEIEDIDNIKNLVEVLSRKLGFDLIKNGDKSYYLTKGNYTCYCSSFNNLINKLTKELLKKDDPKQTEFRNS